MNAVSSRQPAMTSRNSRLGDLANSSGQAQAGNHFFTDSTQGGTATGGSSGLSYRS